MIMILERIRTLGARILYYRRLKGYTQEVLAKKVGISKSYLSKIEHGHYPGCVSLPILYKLAEELDVEMSELVSDQIIK